MFLFRGMQQIYRSKSTPKCDFNKVTLKLYWNRTLAQVFLGNFLHIFRTTFLKNTSPSKHFLFSKTSWRRLEDVFSVTLFVFQDVFKTSSRRVCKTSCNYVFKTSWKTKKCYTEDVFKTSSVRLHQDECLLGWRAAFAYSTFVLQIQYSSMIFALFQLM